MDSKFVNPMNNRYAIIMAGGVGSRFWPLSLSKKPKQFLDILGHNETLLQQTFRRIKTVCNIENIFVVTNADHKELVTEQLGIKPERVLAEPLRRNTAPCIAFGTFAILKENPDALIIVTPADHIIENEEEFRKTVITGFEFAGTNDSLITIGIKPDKPETGYGYVQVDKINSIKGYDNLFKVKAFTEKPDMNLAQEFVKRDDYYWNSGIFIWSANSIVTAMQKFLPDIWSAFSEVKALFGTTSLDFYINKTYSVIRSISIDYGVLELAGNVYVLCTNMGWSDLGTWSSLSEHTTLDKNENAIVRGKVFSFDSSGNVISITPGKTALLQGLKDYIVVDTEYALLIIRKEEEQKIKIYLEDIKNEIEGI